MTDQPYSFGVDADAKLAQIAEHWASGRFDESLAEACALFLSVKDDRTSQLRDAAVELIRLSGAPEGRRSKSERGGDRLLVLREKRARRAPWGGTERFHLP